MDTPFHFWMKARGLVLSDGITLSYQEAFGKRTWNHHHLCKYRNHALVIPYPREAARSTAD